MIETLGTPFREGLAEKAAIAIFGAILGLLTAYIMERVKIKREPRRQLSWDVEVERALVETTSSIKSRIKMSYNGREVEDLKHVSCRVANTGNRVVKNQEIRFKLPEGVHLIESYLEPEPDPEIGVTCTSAASFPSFEECYKIAHLEREESVTFNFVTAGGDFRDWQPRPHNDEGDVAFVRRDVAVSREDEEHIKPFLLLVVGSYAASEIVRSLSLGGLQDLLLLAMNLAFFAAFVPHLLPIVRIVQRLVGHALSRGTGSQVHVEGASRFVVLNNSTAETIDFKERDGSSG